MYNASSFYKRITIRERYNTTSNSYDELYREEQFSKYTVAINTLKHNFLEGRVIDIGCGTGLLIEYAVLKKLITSTSYYVCLDISINMLKVARRRVSNLKLEILVDFVEADAQNLPVRSRSLDIALSFTVFTLLDNPEEGVLEARRVSRGIVLYTLLKKGQRYLNKIPRLGIKVAEDSRDTIHIIPPES